MRVFDRGVADAAMEVYFRWWWNNNHPDAEPAEAETLKDIPSAVPLAKLLRLTGDFIRVTNSLHVQEDTFAVCMRLLTHLQQWRERLVQNNRNLRRSFIPDPTFRFELSARYFLNTKNMLDVFQTCQSHLPSTSCFDFRYWRAISSTQARY